MEKEIRSEILFNKNKIRQIYYNLLLNKFGTFFNTLEGNQNFSKTRENLFLDDNSKISVIFPRLVNLFLKKQKDWSDSIPVITNYFEVISEIHSDFILGKNGYNIQFDEEVRINDENKSDFDNFWKNEVSDKIGNLVEESVATGISGFFARNINGKFTLQPFLFSNYYPEKNIVGKFNKNIVNLVWAWEIENEGGNTEKVDYVITIEQDNEKWTIRHRFFDQTSSHKSGGERKDIRDNFFGKMGDGLINEDGFEKEGNSIKQLEYNPVFLLESPKKDEDTFGISAYKKIETLAQACILCDTILLLEFEEHASSKMALPEGSFDYDKNTNEYTKTDSDYYKVEAGQDAPKYITKENAYIKDIQEQIRKWEEKMERLLKFPAGTFSEKKNGGNIQVETIKTSLQPFDKMISKWRGSLEKVLTDIVFAFFKENSIENIDFQLIVSPIIETNNTEEREISLKEIELGLISKKEYLRQRNPNISESEVDRISEELEEQRKEEVENVGSIENLEKIGDGL